MSWTSQDSASEYNYIKNETYSYRFTQCKSSHFANNSHPKSVFNFLTNTMGAIAFPLLGSLLWLRSQPKRQTIKRMMAAEKQDDKWLKAGNTETWIYVNGVSSDFKIDSN
jgi:hypothetical protein